MGAFDFETGPRSETLFYKSGCVKAGGDQCFILDKEGSFFLRKRVVL